MTESTYRRLQIFYEPKAHVIVHHCPARDTIIFLLLFYFQVYHKCLSFVETSLEAYWLRILGNVVSGLLAPTALGRAQRGRGTEVNGRSSTQGTTDLSFISFITSGHLVFHFTSAAHPCDHAPIISMSCLLSSQFTPSGT